MENVSIGIVGVGAVGGFFGAKFALAGYHVVFLSRGKTLKFVKTNGLRFDSIGKQNVIKDAVFTDNPEDLKMCKYIFFTVKSYDSLSAISQIKTHISPDATIITPQNGINNDVFLSDAFGKQRVLPALLKIGVSTPELGFVKHTGLGILVVGEYDGKSSLRLNELLTICNKAGIECIVTDKIQVERWKKYIWNCTFNIIASITRLRLDQILNDASLKFLCESTIKELLMIADKEHIHFDDEKDPIQARITFAEKLGTFKPSTLEDLEKGKKIELDAFTGYVLSLAHKYTVSAPINEALYALLHGIVELK
jgi:2-dehydropantoate 2-reductase